ncbi:MAG: glycosyltransferase, partial [Microcystaceae cyanobacterium]
MMANSLRTLFITKGIPYPPGGGVSLRNWQNINIMQKYGTVGVVSIERGNAESQTPPNINLWLHYNIAKPLSRWEKWERRLWWMRPYGHPDFDWLYRKAIAQALDEILTNFQPQLVIFEQLWLYLYLRGVRRYGCQVIFDEHNVEVDLFQQKHGALKLRLPRLKAIELDFIRKADQVWVCSEEDAFLLKDLYGQSFNSFVVPNGIKVTDYDCVRLAKGSSASELGKNSYDILFLGTFSYPPNQVAAKLLIDQIYPQLHQIYPHCRLLLVGTGPT